MGSSRICLASSHQHIRDLGRRRSPGIRPVAEWRAPNLGKQLGVWKCLQLRIRRDSRTPIRQRQPPRRHVRRPGNLGRIPRSGQHDGAANDRSRPRALHSRPARHRQRLRDGGRCSTTMQEQCCVVVSIPTLNDPALPEPAGLFRARRCARSRGPAHGTAMTSPEFLVYGPLGETCGRVLRRGRETCAERPANSAPLVRQVKPG